jgi:SAM-dependent methyltransferase
MHLIQGLMPHSRVLDLGASAGSFAANRKDVTVVRLDLEKPHAMAEGWYVWGDAARMPFASHSFDLIVSNHSLEHFHQLEAALREAGRVLKPGGVVYVAVPDATTLTDRIYRWLGRGGGHVNAFRRPEEVIALVEPMAGVKHHRTKKLYSSLSFLNSHNFVARPPRRIALFAFGNERFLASLNWLLRGLDRRLGTRLSRYGWAFEFGGASAADPQEEWVNVCVRCGAGHSEAYLRRKTHVRRVFWFWERYRCPACRGFNLLSPEAPG